MWRRWILSVLAVCGCVASAVRAQEPTPAIAFELDGLRFIKTLHQKEGLSVFSNNGVLGTGLVLSFAGKLNTPVLEASNLVVERVVLTDGSALPAKQIRNTGGGWGIHLGSDQCTVGINVDLAYDRLSNFQSISGTFAAKRPLGEQTVRSGMMKDEKGSTDTGLGIVVEDASNWGFERFVRMKLNNAERLIRVKVLDAEGKELKQTDAFQAFSGNQLKLYVDMKKDTAFSLELSMAEKIETIKIPFTISPVKVLE